MSKNKKKLMNKKAFTLIELLITIVVLSLVMVISFATYNFAIDKAKDKKNQIVISNIKQTAYVYTDEFKQSSGYWFDNNDDTDLEYSCLTIGSMINKGYLNENVVGTEIDGNAITSGTNIKILRNKNTKVYNKNLLSFDSEDCASSSSDFEVELTINSGIKSSTNNNWYISNVGIDINIANYNLVPEDGYQYELIYTDASGQSITQELYPSNRNDLINYNRNEDVLISTEGSNIKFCLKVTDYKDTITDYCIDNINIDKTPPTTDTLVININNGLINASGAVDNVTTSTNIIYSLSGDAVSSNNMLNISGLSDSVISKPIIVTVSDEAGNTTTNQSYEVNLLNSQTATPTLNTTYSCSLNNSTYTSQSEASNDCKGGTVTSENYCNSGYSYYNGKCYSSSNINATEVLGCTGNAVQVGNQCQTTSEDVKEGVGHCTCKEYHGSYSEEDCTTYTDTYKSLGYTCNSEPRQACTQYMKNKKIYYDFTCTKSITTSTSLSVVGYSCPDGYEQSGSGSNSRCTQVISPNVKYYCSLNTSVSYNYKSLASDACKSGNVSTNPSKYYCSLTEKTYSDENSATKACTNYCSTGYNYYSGSCFKIGKV